MIGILSYKTWLIEPTFASRMAPIIMRSIEQGTHEKFFEQTRKKHDLVIKSFYAGVDADVILDDDGVPPFRIAKASNGKKVAIITMMGAITKNGDACSYGMRDHQNQMTKILKNPEIAGVVFHYNNAPGGSHDGTPEIAHSIFNYPLNNVGFVDGMAASAHYYMASQNKHVMMNSRTDSEVGSIGSLIVSENIQNLIESGRWPNIEIIRAPQSINKALFNYIEPLSKAVRAELNEDLRLGVDAFIADVKRGRGSRLKEDKEMFTGKMYTTDIAIEKGLADSKGTLQDAINLAASMPATKPASVSNNNKSKEDSMKKNIKRASSFNKNSKRSAEGETPAASAPQWTADMVFNTDGSGDGAFCTHPDVDGNSREFETKVDENQGNEPPTDPTVTEDEFWSLVEASESADGGDKESKATITKLNADLKKSTADLTKLNGEVSTLSAKVTAQDATIRKLTEDNAALKAKLDAEPAGNATTVIEGEGKSEAEERFAKSTNSWDQKAKAKFGIKN